MKSFFLPLLAAAALGGATLAAAPFTKGNLVVLRVEIDNPAYPPTMCPGTLLEITGAGAIVQSIPIPAGPGGILFDNNFAAMSLSADGTRLLLPGYRPPFASFAMPEAQTDADAPRVYIEIDTAGGISEPIRVFTFNNDRFLSVARAESHTWVNGNNAGIRLLADGGSSSPISSAFVGALRPVAGRLFLNRTSPSVPGIYAFSGFPLANDTPPLIAIWPAAGFTQDFTVNEAGTALYAVGGESGDRYVIRFDRASGNDFPETHRFNLTPVNARGIHSDFLGTPRVWIADAEEILTGIDAGAATTLSTILPAPAGFRFLQINAVPAESNAPMLVIRQPASARTTTTAARARIRGRVTDDSGVASLSYRLGRRSVELPPAGRFSFTVRLRPGRNVVRLTARDYSGNRATARRVFLRT